MLSHVAQWQDVYKRQEYRQNWKSHLDRMVDPRIPKQAFAYRPVGTSDPVQEKKKKKNKKIIYKYEARNAYFFYNTTISTFFEI